MRSAVSGIVLRVAGMGKCRRLEGQRQLSMGTTALITLFHAGLDAPPSFASLSISFVAIKLPRALGYADASQIAGVILDAVEKGFGNLLSIRRALQQALGMRI